MMRSDTRFEAVLFDLGGVVLGSPLHAIADYERERGLPANFVNRVVAATAPHGGWARLERGELSMEAFYEAFEADCRDAGHEISAREMMNRMNEAAKPREAMLRAIACLRAAGLRTAAVTNNWVVPEEIVDQNPPGARSKVAECFDVFVESSVEGLRKPDPAIYHLTCARLGVAPQACVFLDDIGSNLKSARALGMATIKVDAPDSALRELEALVRLDLRIGEATEEATGS